MFRLKKVYIWLGIIATIAFFTLYSKGIVPYSSIYLLIAVVSPVSYFLSSHFAKYSVMASWLAFFPAFTLIYGVDTVNAAAAIILFNLLTICYTWYRHIVKRERNLRHKSLVDNDSKKSKLQDELDRSRSFQRGIRAKESDTVKLYEITRKMSEGLRLEEIFVELVAFLKENFKFRRCDLLILERSDEAPVIGRSYSLSSDEPSSLTVSLLADKAGMADLIKGRPRDLWLSSRDDAAAFHDLGIDGGDGATFAVVPLLSERKMVGALAVEGLQRTAFERFVILSTQFALDLRRVLLYEMVEKLAISDSLTGLYVRRYFHERLEEELQRSRKYGFEVAFIMIDIDDFKKCNDTYGHMVGDVVIKDIARIIRESVRDIDVVSRYGGEEFAIALPETGRESARQVAERLRKKVERTVFAAYDEKLELTVSLGIAVYPQDASSTTDILERADQALYTAKKSGKNVVCEYKR